MHAALQPQRVPILSALGREISPILKMRELRLLKLSRVFARIQEKIGDLVISARLG